MITIGLLTGGGDCPGLNAAIRAVVRAGYHHDIQVLGIRKGWYGLIHGETQLLTNFFVSGILHRGGTILGTSRTNPFKSPDDVDRCIDNYKKYGLEAIIAIGGEDTLGVALKFMEKGLNIIGLPKTIDNDLSGTDQTFGFDTAVSIVCDAIDRIHTTAESHDRVMVVEVMGRHTGWIATIGGIAGGADMIIIPEFPYTIDEIAENLKKRHKMGKNFSIVVVAEGAKLKNMKDFVKTSEKTDEFGHIRLGGIGSVISQWLEEKTGYETRYTVLGHIQRGGSPTAFDRVLATQYGVKAIELVVKKEYGKMVALKNGKIVAVPLDEKALKTKYVPKSLFNIAKIFFG